MKKFFVYLFIFFLCLNQHNSNFAQHQIMYNSQTSVTYVTDLDVALNLSKETKQQIVLVFSAEWCAFCQKLKSDLHKFKELDSKILCILDTDSNKKLTREFKVKTLPTSVIINTDGKEIGRISGYELSSYSKWLKDK